MSWLRTGLAVLAATVLVGGIAVALAARVPDVRDAPLAPDHLGWRGVPVELAFVPDTASADGTRRVQVPVDLQGDPGWLAGVEELHIVFATYATSPALRSLELRDVTGRCRFTATGTARIRNNAATPLLRAGPCDDMTQSPLTLDLRVGMEGRVALWTYDVARVDPAPQALVLQQTQTVDRQQVLRGRTITTLNAHGPRRAELLAYLWTGRTEASRIWLALGLAWVSLAAGLCWLAVRARGSVHAVGGSVLVAVALAGLWAVLLPPLQGADEPDHVLSYLDIVHQQQLVPDLEALARRTHFERIRFYGSERFLPAHVGAPATVAWSAGVHAEAMDHRSPLALLLWRLAHVTIAQPADLSAAGLVFRLRLFNALILALAVGTAAGLMTLGGASRWSLVGLAVIPSLAGFAVAVSDWAFVAAGVVLLAGALVAVVSDHGPEWLRGLTLGGAVAWTITASIAGLALAPLFATVLAARLVLGPSRGARLRDTAAFWSGLTVSLAAGAWVARRLLVIGYVRHDQAPGSGRLLEIVNAVLSGVAEAPWLLLLIPVGAAVIERLALQLRTKPDIVMAGHRLAAAGAALVAIGVVGVLAASAFIALPTLPPLEVMDYGTVEHYVTQVVLVAMTGLRLTNIDHLTFASFWSGFGWIDTIMPSASLAALAAGTALGLALGLAALVRARAYRRLAWTVSLLAGAGGSLVALGLAAGMMNRNIHGRYLLGVYVPLVVCAWLGWSGLASRQGRLGTVTAAMLAVGLVALHAYAAIFVLTRYY